MMPGARCDARVGDGCFLPDLFPFDGVRAVIVRVVPDDMARAVIVHESRYQAWRRGR